MADDSSLLVHSLVERFRRGDKEAFKQLVYRHRERLLSVIRLRFGHQLQQRVDPDDVLQETLLRVYEAREDFRWQGRARFVAWLTTIAERTCTDIVRQHLVRQKQAVQKQVSLSRRRGLRDVLAGSATEPLNDLRRAERLTRLEDALGQLSPEHREVIVLSILQCLPTRKVAERLGITSSAVCMLRTRALLKLRDIFGNTESLRLPPRPISPPSADSADGSEAP